jgi:8-oxo-dGTP pyrophosphatase MutT (NUDIX family)
MLSIYSSDVCEAFAFDSKELNQCDVTVDFSPAYARQPGPPDIEEQVLETWRKRAEANPFIFNGSKFRLHSLEFAAQPLNLHLRVALTDYRTFLGTHYSPSVLELKKRGDELFSDPMACLSNKIGVGALVVLNDGRLVLMQRSNTVAECQGQVDVPGGHAEPKEIGLGHEKHNSDTSDIADSAQCYSPVSVAVCSAEEGKPAEEVTSAAINWRLVQSLQTSLQRQRAENLRLRTLLLPTLVKQELFESAMEEVRAEINIPLAHLSPPKLLGIVHQKNSQGTPSFIFTTECDLSSDEVRRLWEQGAEEKDESVALLLLTEEEIAAGGINLTPATTGAIAVWCAHLKKVRAK